MNEEMAASTSRAMSSTQCATTPSLHALHNTPMKLLFVRVALRGAFRRSRTVRYVSCPWREDKGICTMMADEFKAV